MKLNAQDAVCEFVRDIIAARTDENVEISSRPDLDYRNIPAVEELWESPTRRYAVEHTRVEAFEGQIANQERIRHVLMPIRVALTDLLPGYCVLSVREAEMARARIGRDARVEIARIIFQAAQRLAVGETVTLKNVPVEMRLHLRHRHRSALIIHSVIEGGAEERRLDRIQRALNEKCPKLALWANDGRTSVLALESNDFQLSNFSLIYDAVEEALKARKDQPDTVVLVETDASPMSAWILKEGDRYGDDIPQINGGYCYTEGQIRRR